MKNKIELIDKAKVIEEIEKKKIPFKRDIEDGYYPTYLCALMDFEDFINTLEVKEVNLEKELKKIKQKPAWSEEDEKNLRRAIRATKVVFPEAADWLESLRPQNGYNPYKEVGA